MHLSSVGRSCEELGTLQLYRYECILNYLMLIRAVIHLTKVADSLGFAHVSCKQAETCRFFFALSQSCGESSQPNDTLQYLIFPNSFSITSNIFTVLPCHSL